jgi:hypothetical protein
VNETQRNHGRGRRLPPSYGKEEAGIGELQLAACHELDIYPRVILSLNNRLCPGVYIEGIGFMHIANIRCLSDRPIFKMVFLYSNMVPDAIRFFVSGTIFEYWSQTNMVPDNIHIKYLI